MVRGSSGSPIAPIIFVVDAPNEEDARRGRLFAGKAGDEFDYWLKRHTRLSREDVYLTSIQRDFEKKERPPTPEEIVTLHDEIYVVSPRIICPIGTTAIEHFLGEWASWDLCHGLPHTGHSWTVLPMTNPGAPQYDLMTWDFEQLGKYLRGEIGIHETDTAPVSYTVNRLPEIDEHSIIAIDTEGSVEHPWCLTASWMPRQATLIQRTDDTNWPELFGDILSYYCPTVVMHYAPHDLRVLDAMGVHIDCSKVKVFDTMQLAYIASRLPQGLKPLAYRLCGMRMREYEDLTRDANDQKAAEYMEYLSALFAPTHPKDKKHPVYKSVQRCLKSKRGARALWLDQQPEILAAAAEVAPPLTEVTLDDVPFKEVLPYACADADATRRVFLAMRERYFV